MSSCKIHIPERTLRRWNSNLETKDSLYVDDNPVNRPKLLADFECHVLGGFILSQNNSGTIVTTSGCQNFIKQHFGKEMSSVSMGNYLNHIGMAHRSASTVRKPANKSFSMDDLINQYCSFIRLHDFSSIPRAELCSVDFTYTSHRGDHQDTIAPVSSAQPVIKVDIPLCTNCIVTNVWADGKNRTPSLLFTYNSHMKNFKNFLETGQSHKYNFTKIINHCNEFKVEAHRIIYIEPKTKGAIYCAETKEIFALFYEYYYDTMKNALILHDAGNAFKNISSIHENDEVQYPPDVHQYLSPNDNKVHGTAKNKWRSTAKGHFSDDIERSIELMSYIDEASLGSEQIFKDNLCLGIQEEKINDHIIERVKNWKFSDSENFYHFTECYKRQIEIETQKLNKDKSLMMEDIESALNVNKRKFNAE